MIKETFILKEIVEAQKLAFQSLFAGSLMLQASTIRLFDAMHHVAAWLPDESKRQFEEWKKVSVKGLNDYKAAMDDSYKLIDSYLDSSHS